MPLASRCLTLSSTIVATFIASTCTLLLSIARDLRRHPDVMIIWEERLEQYMTNSTNREELASATRAAISTVLHSEMSVFLMVQWCFAAYALAAVITIYVFLGRLTSIEATKLTERLIRYVIFKVVFCGALIMPDIYDIVSWMAWFAMIGFMRVFLGAAKDRLEVLSLSPLASVSSHLRALALALTILVYDTFGTIAIISSLDTMSLTKVLLCAFDMGIILIEGIKTLVHYAVNMWDRYVASRLARQEEEAVDRGPTGGMGTVSGSLAGRWEAWEGKGSLLLHLDLVADVLVHVMTLTHYVHVWTLHGLSFQMIDGILFLDIRSILFAIAKRIRSYLAYREATHSLKHAFPDAQLSLHQQQQQQQPQGAAGTGVADVQGAEQCAICMERMASAKQLPCGHMFHLTCLRAWLQQSGAESFACPLCRTPLLRPAMATGPRVPPGGGGRLARLGSAARYIASRLYLDVALALLVGLPINPSTVASHARHQWQDGVGGRYQVVGQGQGGRQRAHSRRAPRPVSLLEEVEESGAPLPASATAQQRHRGGGIASVLSSPAPARYWWGLPAALLGPMAYRRRVEEPAPAVAVEAAAAAVERMGWTRVSDMRGGVLASEEEEQQQEEEDSYGDLPSELAVNDNRRLLLMRHRRAWGGRQPFDDEGDPGPSGADEPPLDPPLHPPPYLDDLPTWSASSIHGLVQHVANSIHSSLGMGVRGGGGSVAGIQHETDEEAQSPYRRRGGRRTDREPPAVVTTVGNAVQEIDEAGGSLRGTGQGAGGKRRKSSSHLAKSEDHANTAEGLSSRQLRSRGGRSRC